MLRETGSARRSRGLAFAILLGALSLSGCGGASTRDPDKGTETPYIDTELVISDSKTLRQYRDALLKLGSSNPDDWVAGKRDLDVLHGFRAFDDDPVFLEKLSKGTPREADEARRELARRGVLLDRMLVFTGPYAKSAWDAAARDLLAAGQDGRVLLTITLLKLLINIQYHEACPHIRSILVQAGDVAFETTLELTKRKADEAPDTAVGKQEDIKQLIMALIGFGDRARPHVQALAKHRNWKVRKVLARAIAEAVDTTDSDILVAFLDDPDWQVQAAAAESMGHLGPARAKLGPILIAALKKEVARQPRMDRYVVMDLLKAMGEIHYLPAIEILLNAVDMPDIEIAEAAMYGLYRLTGEKFKAGPDWHVWYREVYPTWIKKQPKD